MGHVKYKSLIVYFNQANFIRNMVKRSTNLSVEGLAKLRVSQTGYCSVNFCQKGKG